MGAEDIEIILQDLPEYIEYIYPGYLAMFLYSFFKGKTLKDNSYVLMKSIAISYIFNIMKETVAVYVDFSHIEVPYSLKENLCLVILSVSISYIMHLLTSSKNTQYGLDVFHIKTRFYDNEMDVLSEFGEGAWLCVYLKDEEVVYEGALGNKELEDGKTKYICLHKYYKYLLDDEQKPKEPYIEDHGADEEEIVLIYYDEIKRIEKRNTRSNGGETT